MKQCADCKEFKIEREFSKDKSTKDGYDYQCKKCNSVEYKRLWASDEGKEKQRLRSRKYELKKLYGITLEDYDSLLKKQNGACAICERKTMPKLGHFHIDHDHKTGKIRGLLCIQCNVSLGMLKDNPSLIAKVTQYLEYNSPKNTQLEVI